MAREPNGGLGYGALLVQEGKEALEDPEAGLHRARGQGVTKRGLDPGIHIRGGRLRQVMSERGLARLRHEDDEVFEGADGAFLHRRAIATRTYIDQIVPNKILVLRTQKVQQTELGELLQCWSDTMLLHTSLLFHTPRSPVEDRELSMDCLHNHYYAYFPATQSTMRRVPGRITDGFFA